MPFEHTKRSLRNGRPYDSSSVVTGDAGDQPGAIPVLDGEPTIDRLPTTADGTPTGLLYADQTADAVKIALPDDGSVTNTVLLDVSATVSLGSGNLTGLL